MGSLAFILLLLVLCSTLFFPATQMKGLDFQEEISGDIEFVSPNSHQFILTRGDEDGIIVSDMVKVYSGDYLIGSAVCIVTEKELSEWVIHRNFRPGLLKVNTATKLISLYGIQKPVINNLSYYQKRSELNQRLKKYTEELYLETKRKLEKKNNLLFEQYKIERYHFMKFPDAKLTIKASPLTLQVPYYEKNWQYGLILENYDKTQHDIAVSYQYKTQHYKTNHFGDRYRKSDYRGDVVYKNNKIWEPFKYHSLNTFRREEDGNLQPIRYQVDLGPVGITYPWKSANGRNLFAVSYIPQYEIFSSTYVRRGKIMIYKDNYIRHSIFLSFDSEIGEKTTLKEEFSVRPNFQGLKDIDLKNNLIITHTFTEKFGTSFGTFYSWDIRRKNLNRIPSSRIEFSLQISYMWDLLNLRV